MMLWRVQGTRQESQAEPQQQQQQQQVPEQRLTRGIQQPPPTEPLQTLIVCSKQLDCKLSR
jgi:hypothetical protein